jgi:hypothetical protein
LFAYITCNLRSVILSLRLQTLSVDQRGVASMEAGILGFFLVALLLPISDVAAMAVTYMRTYQAMRDVAAYAVLNPPPNITAPATWPTLPSTMSGFSIAPKAATTNPPSAATPGATIPIFVTVGCGDPPAVGTKPVACTAADVTSLTTPKWVYVLSAVQLNPMFLTGLTGGSLSFSQEFQ